MPNSIWTDERRLVFHFKLSKAKKTQEKNSQKKNYQNSSYILSSYQEKWWVDLEGLFPKNYHYSRKESCNDRENYQIQYR